MGTDCAFSILPASQAFWTGAGGVFFTGACASSDRAYIFWTERLNDKRSGVTPSVNQHTLYSLCIHFFSYEYTHTHSGYDHVPPKRLLWIA